MQWSLGDVPTVETSLDSDIAAASIHTHRVRGPGLDPPYELTNERFCYAALPTTSLGATEHPRAARTTTAAAAAGQPNSAAHSRALIAA